jgi:hypothetical protein
MCVVPGPLRRMQLSNTYTLRRVYSVVGGKVRRRNREIIKGLVKLINVFKLVEKKNSGGISFCKF